MKKKPFTDLRGFFYCNIGNISLYGKGEMSKHLAAMKILSAKVNT